MGVSRVGISRSLRVRCVLLVISLGLAAVDAACHKSDDAGFASADGGPSASGSAACPVPSSEAVEGVYPESALPAGACTSSEACNLSVQRASCTCDDLVDDYLCQCVAGTWSCGIVNQATTACSCADASTDADTDAGDGGDASP